MSPTGPSTLAPKQEKLLLYTLAGFQFTTQMDFAIMMPLGANFMRAFGITPGQFAMLLAAYAISAGMSGLIGGFFIDRFDRRNALLSLYSGFTLSLIACAFAPSYEALLLARIATGAFGGTTVSLLIAMVGDSIPPERRGKAMGTVMASHPISLIIGVPTGLVLASWKGWNTHYFLLSGLCLGVLWCASKTLPHVYRQQSDAHPVRHIWNILNHRIHIRAFLVRASLVMSGGLLMPFMAASMVLNVGLSENVQLPLLYVLAGMVTFFTIPYIGRLSDRFDKVHVLMAISAIAIPTVLVITRLGPGPLYFTYFVTTLLFVCVSGRFTPAMALITNSVESKYRGGFMSLNSAVQHTVTGCANVIGGFLVTMGADGKLIGYPKAGWFACLAFVISLLLAFWLRSAAPHAARNKTPEPPSEPML